MSKEMDRERAYRDYAATQMASEFLDKTFKLLYFTTEQRRHFCKSPMDFRYGDTSHEFRPHFTNFTTNDFNHGVFHSLYAALEEVRERRGRLAKVNDINIISQAKINSEVYAKSIVGATFPRLKVDNVFAKKSVDAQIDRKHSSYFGTSYTITVPITWSRSVLDRHIATVNDGKLTHVVLQAKERKLDRLNNDDIKAYKCLSMTGNNGDPQLHDTWVLRWDNGTTSIIALSTEFSKTENLLRRRIKKAVTDVLLDF